MKFDVFQGSLAFHVAMLYFLPIKREADSLIINPWVTQFCQLTLFIQIHINIHWVIVWISWLNLVPEGKSSGFGFLLDLKLLEIKSKFWPQHDRLCNQNHFYVRARNIFLCARLSPFHKISLCKDASNWGSPIKNV